MENLTEQISKFSLLVQKIHSEPTQESMIRTSSYCMKLHHGALRYPDNPNRNNRCRILDKLRHSEATCWEKFPSPEQRNVWIAEADVQSKAWRNLKPCVDSNATISGNNRIMVVTGGAEVGIVNTT